MTFAAEHTVVVDVSGSCNSCRKKIVKAAEKVDGVIEADWDKKTKKMTATFDDAKTNKEAIVKAVLAAGYDADGKTGSEEAYKHLPECCQYREAETH